MNNKALGKAKPKGTEYSTVHSLWVLTIPTERYRKYSLTYSRFDYGDFVRCLSVCSWKNALTLNHLEGVDWRYCLSCWLQRCDFEHGISAVYCSRSDGDNPDRTTTDNRRYTLTVSTLPGASLMPQWLKAAIIGWWEFKSFQFFWLALINFVLEMSPVLWPLITKEREVLTFERSYKCPKTAYLGGTNEACGDQFRDRIHEIFGLLYHCLHFIESRCFPHRRILYRRRQVLYQSRHLLQSTHEFHFMKSLRNLNSNQTFPH